MTAINSVTDLSMDGDVAVITLNSPPVNALSANVREGLFEGFKAATADPAAKAIVLICEGRTFIAGADITEFGGASRGPSLFDVQEMMENAPKPVIAAIHGTALGGGLEVALVAHYRVAVPSARLGLPEVNLGLLPGAGGTQRLPRVAGPEKALEMMTSGRHAPAKEALEMGLVDELAEEGKLREAAVAFARRCVAENKPLVKVRDNNAKVEAARGKPEIFEAFRKANARKFRGFLAPEYNIRCIEAAVNLPFDEGLAVERKLFGELVTGSQSAAQRYSFFAERQAQKIPDVPDDTPLIPVKSVGIIGAGTMGGGIAMNFANVGIPVTIVEVQKEALERGLKVIRGNYERTASRGGITAAQVEERMALINGSLDMNALAPVDLVIEAVFERMDVKKDIFTKLDAICKPGAILATNTSGLNIDEIASVTKRPEAVIGLHFFSPANVMKLLEIVRADHTSKSVIATSMKLAKQIGKIAALVGVCPGFVGNRILAQRQREAQKLVMEGAMPWDVDRVLYDFGFPMGPFAMSDLAGLDIGWVKERSKGESIRDVLCEMDRRGQKTGAGYYDYDENRNAKPSPVTEKIINDFIVKTGSNPRTVSDEEILERCIYPMINEGVKILEEGKAIRSSDIDVVWQNGYGWPVYRGGPMWYGDQIGPAKVLEKMKEFQAKMGDDFKPAPLLEKLVADGKKFSDL
ncbi:MAG: enoyl-CoA hydratase/isomerase family protein [Phenylobacterium sp.]|jgi:3-hydroxyacyl-CoA dehydrogenase|uniref:3-hydroxyacyl-CoA dehydrogenase NAD-binding domain-containing protein n=1 Tax=Phenylobacterium sp. TaxID=1871053 RepID=UPI0025E4D07E|nr:3-hydroxyacyl-CoA dehydrogenase NAD-binding domain-containing protein [Phenylobacterium sp.]MCA3708461.1 enoyl-CoA hydratase/isomerase family protein [Phenylobacterium sp.]MCA3711849.1 enoyl-CoA hydratase/isomerase family protein [Phenylobacterium sp.]MCA3714917.1 enoyl-CoA hydratase/isomerase family protein [Phenylobacterium sp.]MCA3728154.1 enoyl-CoA hydratase/isomerase family protein [Phenylobacterium sp.]MCA3732211.1 enoyl-CoA hydratase/isomerase family protein [Phenylobacterium sp.]